MFFPQLTYAGIMIFDIQEVSTATAFITAPCILARAFRALTCSLLFAFINICKKGKFHNINVSISQNDSRSNLDASKTFCRSTN